jgi:hypothetical protein
MPLSKVMSGLNEVPVGGVWYEDLGLLLGKVVETPPILV